MKLDSLTVKFLGVLAGNRRLADLSGMIGAFDAIVAAHRGEVTAQVTSAHPLTAAQVKALTAHPKTRVGRHVTVPTTVDPAILGRSEERRVGKECVSTRRSRWTPHH